MKYKLRYLRKYFCLHTIPAYLRTQKKTSVQQFIRGYITSSVDVTRLEMVSRCRQTNGTLSVSFVRPRSDPLQVIRMAGGASPWSLKRGETTWQNTGQWSPTCCLQVIAYPQMHLPGIDRVGAAVIFWICIQGVSCSNLEQVSACPTIQCREYLHVVHVRILLDSSLLNARECSHLVGWNSAYATETSLPKILRIGQSNSLIYFLPHYNGEWEDGVYDWLGRRMWTEYVVAYFIVHAIVCRD